MGFLELQGRWTAQHEFIQWTHKHTDTHLHGRARKNLDLIHAIKDKLRFCMFVCMCGLIYWFYIELHWVDFKADL